MKRNKEWYTVPREESFRERHERAVREAEAEMENMSGEGEEVEKVREVIFYNLFDSY